jgi:hypothetical protein
MTDYKKPGMPSLHDLFNVTTLDLVCRLCHAKDDSGSDNNSIRADRCKKISTAIGKAAILLVRKHRGYCSLRLCGALHGLRKWIESEFNEDEVLFLVNDHDELKESADDMSTCNGDLMISIRTTARFTTPDLAEFRELLELILADLTNTDKRYKRDITRQLVTEIIEYVPPCESDALVTFSADDPRSGSQQGDTAQRSRLDGSRSTKQTTSLLDRTEKQQFVALMMRLVESSMPYISDELYEHNERVDAIFSDLFIESAATPLIRLSTIYERKVKVMDSRSYRVLLLKYRDYIEQDFKTEIIVARNEEIDRHSLNVNHKSIVSNADLWSVVIDFCNLLKTEDLNIFLKASAMLLRILSEYTDDILGIEAEKISASLRRRTARAAD